MDWSQVTKKPPELCPLAEPLTPIRIRGCPARLVDMTDLYQDGRSIALMHNPLEFADPPRFEQGTRDIDPDG